MRINWLNLFVYLTMITLGIAFWYSIILRIVELL
jgi:hypothetical protein